MKTFLAVLEQNRSQHSLNILVTNADGIDSIGLKMLVKALIAKGHNVFIIASHKNRSCIGHAVSMWTGIQAYPYHWGDHLTQLDGCCYISEGTPVDCVRLALGRDGIAKQEFDCLVSGINTASNLGVDLWYSGTVATAREGSLFNLPSFALSLDQQNHFTACDDLTIINQKREAILEGIYYDSAIKAESIIQNLLKSYNRQPFAFNINFPPNPDLKKVVLTTPSKSRAYKIHVWHHNPWDSVSDYRIHSCLSGEPESDPDSDVAAIEKGYISVTILT